MTPDLSYDCRRERRLLGGREKRRASEISGKKKLQIKTACKGRVRSGGRGGGQCEVVQVCRRRRADEGKGRSQGAVPTGVDGEILMFHEI